jgi:hypothetical protein
LAAIHGWQDLKRCYFHIGANPSVVNNVTLLYNWQKDKLWLLSDDGRTWTGGYAPGSANSLENSQVQVDCSLTIAQGHGDRVIVAWAVTFKPGFSGNKKMYSKCEDVHGASAAGEKVGNWSIDSLE